MARPPFAIYLCALALVGCGTEAAEPDTRPQRFLSVQPIQVCDDAGSFCADLALFTEATRKVWAQADIEITFLPPNQLWATRFLTVDSRSEVSELSSDGPPGAYGRHPFSTRTTGPINMWFVDKIFQGAVEVVGLAWIGRNGVFISDDILDFNRGQGRIDTVAHEIGHNLGLTHDDFGSGTNNNLMTSGRRRAIPSTLDDIGPEGPVSQLTNEQVEVARDSDFVTATPELSAPIPTGLPLPELLRLEDLEEHNHGHGEGYDFDAPYGEPELAFMPHMTLAPYPQAAAAEPPIQTAVLSASFDSQEVPEPSAWLGLGLLGLLGWRRCRG